MNNYPKSAEELLGVIPETTDIRTKTVGNSSFQSELSESAKDTVLEARILLRQYGRVYTARDLAKILGLTIFGDHENKVITFLCMLAAYSDSDQFNVSLNAPSSSGKTYIPLEVQKLFPPKDVVKLGYTSPTAFFHDKGTWNKATQEYLVDMSNKIYIFLDQPHTQLLEHLRPLLSHDERTISLKITDKTQKHGLKAKTVVIKGFPSVIFCTAKLRIDEQESTRFLLLSPETTEEKIKQSIKLRLKYDADRNAYLQEIENNPERKRLKEILRLIRDAKITEIKIHNPELIYDEFAKSVSNYKPRHSRDIARVTNIVKAFALLNTGKRAGDKVIRGTIDYITTTDEDIQEAFKLWVIVNKAQELNLPPYVYDILQKVLIPLFSSRESGIKRREIASKYQKVFKRYLPEHQLRREVIPMLIDAGLVFEERNPDKKNEFLLYPNTYPTSPSLQDREFANEDFGLTDSSVKKIETSDGKSGFSGNEDPINNNCVLQDLAINNEDIKDKPVLTVQEQYEITPDSKKEEFVNRKWEEF